MKFTHKKQFERQRLYLPYVDDFAVKNKTLLVLQQTLTLLSPVVLK